MQVKYYYNYTATREGSNVKWGRSGGRALVLVTGLLLVRRERDPESDTGHQSSTSVAVACQYAYDFVSDTLLYLCSGLGLAFASVVTLDCDSYGVVYRSSSRVRLIVT